MSMHKFTQACTVRPWAVEDGPRLQGWRNQRGQLLPTLPEAGEQGFVLCDGEDVPLAALRLCPGLGLRRARYSFHLGQVVHASEELGLFQVQRTLLLGNDHTGAAELLDLALSPQLPEGLDGLDLLQHLLRQALARWRAPTLPWPAGAPSLLVVELAGWRDAQGGSPFWQGLGARFLDQDPLVCAERLGPDWHGQLAALLPRQLLYLSFLSEAAQACVGRPHEALGLTQAALRAVGFGAAQHVRIDDGGPILTLAL